MAVVPVVLVSSPAEAQVNAEQVLAIGRNVLSMDDYMLAIQYFNQAIKAKPYMADPYFYRALAKLNLDDYKGAEQDCSLALERNKFKTEAYKVRGFARQQMGLDSLAIEDYDLGLQYNPYDKYFLFYKAVAQTESKRYAGADTTFTTLLHQFPAFDDGYAARSRLNTLRGDTVAALADIGKTLELSPSHANALLMRADILTHRSCWEDALADMDRVVKLMPQEADMYVNRAYLRYRTDDYFGAMSDYNYALQLDPANSAAMFNRALLRYEVKDLERAAADFTSVLSLDPLNFHALYNRGLVWLETGKPRQALADFEAIARRYPRFYPAYYAMAEAWRDLGDMRNAMRMARYGDSLVEGYVKDPQHHALDRPTIASTSNDRGSNRDEGESEEDVMSRFNQLVTLSGASDTQLAYNEKIKGRVQDRDVKVEPEPFYVLSMVAPPASLKSVSNYFRELDELNAGRYIDRSFYLSPGMPSAGSEEVSAELFALLEKFNDVISSGHGRPVDYLGRGVTQTMLRNYPAAIADLNKALELNSRFAVAYMARAFARYGQAASEPPHTDDALASAANARAFASVIADYDEALRLNPRLLYALFNKGNVYYLLGDFTSAMECYSEAIRLDDSFGQAYFNRGLTLLRAGNKQRAFADLSKAGELGVLPAYNLLKRMK